MLVISIFVGKIKLNFHYKKMTEKMYHKLLEKYKDSVFQILKIGKAFSNFGLNLTIRKKIHLVVQLFKKKVIERFSLTSHTEHPNQIHPRTYFSFSTIFLENKEDQNISSVFHMVSLSDRNYDYPTLFHEIHHFAE